MAGIYCTTGAIQYGAISQGNHTQIVWLTGDFYGIDQGFTNYAYWTFGVTHTDTAPYNIITGLNGFTFGDGGSGYQAYEVNGSLQGNYSQTPALRVLPCDTTHVRRAKITDDGGGSAQGASISFKTYAVTATASTPGSSSVTATTATINCDYFPNTVESTATIWLEYKKSADSTWITAGATTAQTGYGILNLSRNLTGLTGSTQYQFRLQMTRTTENETTLTSATSTFTTAAAAPTIATVAASSVGAISAVLNATVDANSISTDVSFEYDTNSGAPYASSTSPAETVSTDGNQGVSKLVTGLAHSTTYYYRAKAVYSGGTIYGSELSFTTAADPISDAKDEDMLPIQTFDRKYGVATTIYFVVPPPAATSSDLFYTGAAVWAAAGESKISKNGAAWADTASDPAASTAGSQLFKLDLTAAELQTDEAFILLNDAGGAVRDVLLRVRTHMELGSVDIDAATGAKANTTGFKVTGYGSGHGLSAVAGATGQDINGAIGKHCLRVGLTQAGSAGGTVVLDASANGNDDFYNGNIVVITAGTGIGQARVITDYVQSTKTCSVHKTWVTTPGTGDSFLILPGNDLWEVSPLVELAALPTSASSFGKMFQFLFQRFAFKRTQTATQHLMFNAASTAGGIFKATVADGGGTQSFNKVEIV